MTEIVKAYPLQWPAGWKRTEPHQRRRGQFHTTGWHASPSQGNPGGGWKVKKDVSVAQAVERVRAELTRMAITENDMVISTNLVLRMDGLPRSDQKRPVDPGAAVYWQDASGARRCMAIDQYDLVEHNLAAIAATLDAMRAIERHGGAEILDRAFTGFAALPAPVTGGKPWRDELKVEGIDLVTVEGVQAAYRIRRSQTHPDKGGDEQAFLAVQAAYEAAGRELGFPV